MPCLTPGWAIPPLRLLAPHPAARPPGRPPTVPAAPAPRRRQPGVAATDDGHVGRGRQVMLRHRRQRRVLPPRRHLAVPAPTTARARRSRRTGRRQQGNPELSRLQTTFSLRPRAPGPQDALREAGRAGRSRQGDHRRSSSRTVLHVTRLAAEVGLSEAAVRQRVQRLLDGGLMQIVAVTDPLMIGFRRPGGGHAQGGG